MHELPAIQSDWHRLGAGLSVRFRLADGQINAEWHPRRPTKREFKRLVDRYREARNLFLTEVGRARGVPVLCLELPL